MKRVALYLFSLLLAVLLLSEIALRILGKTPHCTHSNSPTSVPPHFVKPDTSFFIKLNEGRYLVSLNNNLRFTVTHTTAGTRLTVRHTAGGLPLKTWIFTGCSFTYGFGVDDTCTYLYKASDRCAHINIENHAVPGYGTLETLILLKKLIAENQKLPDVLVYNYMDFHQERNYLNAAHRLNFIDGYQTTITNSPGEAAFFSAIHFTGAVIKNDTIAIEYLTVPQLKKREFPLRRKSALADLVATGLDKLSLRKSEKITRSILAEINQLCAKHHIRFLVSYMQPNFVQSTMYKFLQQQKVAFVDITYDNGNPANYNYPSDGHPSPLAHELMAEKLVAFIKTQK